MTILLAGASGFLGRHVKVALEQAGHTVLTWPRGAYHGFNPALSDSDLLINCAGNTECPERMYVDNVRFAMEMLEVARGFGKRLIHVGTIAEDLPGNSVYQATKRAATNLCLAYAEEWNVDVCVVKPSTIYGVGDKDTAFLPTLWRAYKQGTAFTVTQGYRNWIHVTDAAAAIVILATATETRGKTYQALSSCDYLNQLLVSTFSHIVGKQIETITGEMEPQWSGGDISPLQDLGWEPQYDHDLERGIREFVEHMQMEEQVWLGAEA